MLDNIFRVAGIMAVYMGALLLSMALCVNLPFLPTLFVTSIMLFVAHAFVMSMPDDN